jgi:protein-S-isoprenylcysteine O-methyltransferase Ste14
MPLFIFPLISVVTAPLAALVVLRIVQAFFSIRNVFMTWVTTTYILLVVQAIALSVMLSRLLPKSP